tara:strand:+ start:366 stop:551 length:186 start_codon:yes stop_codon:yes gene_type:complete
MKKRKRFWVAWSYKRNSQEIFEDTIAEINDMLLEHKIKINHKFNWVSKEWDYKVNLKLEKV